jgi:hypothetical protein
MESERARHGIRESKELAGRESSEIAGDFAGGCSQVRDFFSRRFAGGSKDLRSERGQISIFGIAEVRCAGRSRSGSDLDLAGDGRRMFKREI